MADLASLYDESALAIVISQDPKLAQQRVAEVLNRQSPAMPLWTWEAQAGLQPAVAGVTDAEADRLATSIDLNIVRRAKGEYLPIASPDEAAAYPYTPIDRERVRENRKRIMAGWTRQANERRLSAAQARLVQAVQAASQPSVSARRDSISANALLPRSMRSARPMWSDQ